MRDTILKVGDKAQGFEFKNGAGGIYWEDDMKKHIGKIGKVTNIRKTNFTIEFKNETWLYPISLMHLAVVEEQPKVIEIDFNDIKKIEHCHNGEWVRCYFNFDKWRFTFKTETENTLKIQQEIEELEERINELKKQL